MQSKELKQWMDRWRVGVREIVAQSCLDPRTIEAFLAGANIRESTRRMVESACAQIEQEKLKKVAK